MIVLPVIERELRTCARQPFTYYLRALGVASLLLSGLLFGMEHGFSPALGSRLFRSLHLTLFGAIWVLVPLLTADCISRERREGTLGLLFLTRLSATDIVAAKSLAHGLRALTLWLAVLPVLTVPFLLGGVSAVEALLSIAINFSAICWALAVGLLASAWSRSWLRAMLGAGVLAFFLLIAFSMVVGETMLHGTSSLLRSGSFQTRSDFVFLSGFGFIAGGSAYFRLFTPSMFQLFGSLGLLASISLLMLLLAVVASGRNVRRIWQEPPPSKLRNWWERTFCTPMFLLSFFRQWMLRQIEHNPIGWLERRTWTGRLVTWGWFAVVISYYTAALSDQHFLRGLGGLQNGIAWFLAGSLAVSSAGSFRRERESGVLELLLVSPLGEGDIISGRLRGLWGQFLPAFGTLFFLWFYFMAFIPGAYDQPPILFHMSTFLALPVIGLYYSLRCRNFLAAFLMTLSAGLLVPIIAAALLFHDPTRLVWRLRLSPAAACIQCVVAYLCGSGLYQRLKQRAFPFTQESGV